MLIIDANFPNKSYNNRGLEDAIKLVELARAEYQNIEAIFVTDTEPMRRYFQNAPDLPDGRKINDIFENHKAHADHFHIRLRSRSPQ